MKQTILLALFTCLSFSAIGQFQNPCAPPGEDKCADAEFIDACRLDGWVSHTDPPNSTFIWNGDIPRFNWCDDAIGFTSSIENNQWLKFEAVEDHLYIDVDISACNDGNGIQMGAYEIVDPITGSCPGNQITCFSLPSGQNGTVVFEIDNLIPGVEYLLMIDGFGGDGCPFVLDITSGIPPTLEVDVETLEICPGVPAQGALVGSVTNFDSSDILKGWATDNGNIISGHFDFTAIIDEPGDYTFFAFDPETCCGGFTTVTVTAATDLPDAQAMVIQHIGCTSSTATVSAAGSEVDNGLNVFEYIWTFPNGNIAGTGFELEGLTFTGDYILIVRNISTGCESEVVVTVEEDFIEPEITLQAPPVLNCTDTATFLLVDAPMGSTFDWFNDNGFSSVDQAPMVTEAGDYEVIVTGANGCTSRDTITVMDDLEGPLLQVQTLVLDCAAPVAPILVINGNDETTYAWEGPNFTSTEMSPMVSDTGTYTLVATNPNGCSETYILSVQEDMTPPNIAIENDNILDCNLTAFALSSTSDSEIMEYAWSGPNGFISAEEMPEINAPGTYMLNVTDEKGCTNSTTVTITDNLTPPVLTLESGDVLDCATDMVQLISSSDQTITAYEWSDNLGTDPTAEVSEAGTYMVTVTGENGCTQAFDVVVTDNFQMPTPDAGPDAELTCADSETMLTAGGSSVNGGNLSFEWILNGNPIGLGTNLQVTSTGTYQVIVTDEVNGCTAIDEVIVSSNDDIPEVVLEQAVSLDCNNNTVNLSGINSTAGSNISYEWLDENRNPISSSIDISVSDAGTYIFIVRNTDNGCLAELPILVEDNFMEPVPEVDNIELLNCLVTSFTAEANNLNNDVSNITYQWFDTDSGALLGENRDLEITNEGNYNLIITNQDNGCISEFPFPVSMDTDLPIADAGDPFTITCADAQAILDASNSQGNDLTYQWLDSDGNVIAETANTSTQDDGEFTLIVTDTQNGCIAQSTVIIDSNADFPEIEFNDPVEINCDQLTSLLDASSSNGTGTLSFEWFDENGTLLSDEPGFEVDAAGTYRLVLTDTDSDCTIEEMIIVTDNFQSPDADAGQDQIITCDISNVALDGSSSSTGNDFSYEWFNSNNVLVGSDATIDVETSGDYTLIVTDERNGCTASSLVSVRPDENIPVVEVANDGILSCMQDEVNIFSTLADNPNYTYSWENEAGDEISTETSFMTDIPGVYTLTALDGTNGCSSSMSILVEDNFTEPELSSEIPEIINCNNENVEINASVADPTGNYEFTWSSETQDNIGNEATLSTDATGIFTLTVVNLISGCTNSIEVEVFDNFDIDTPIPEISNILDCNTTSATIALSGVDQNSYTFSWTDQNGDVISDQMNFTSENEGIFEVTATNTLNGCTSSIMAEIRVDRELPVVAIPNTDILNCQILDVQLLAESDPNFDYQWMDENGTVISNNLDVNVSTPGEFQVLVTNPSNGCQSIETIQVQQNVNMPQAVIEDLSPQGLSCTQQSVVLDGGASTPIGNVSYQWFDENGLLVSEDAFYEASASGTYNLVITDLTTLCKNNVTTLVSQDDELPMVDIAPPNVLTCAESIITLNASGSILGSEFEYIWTTPVGVTDFDDTDILNPTVSTPGTYTLTITNTLTGCDNQLSLEVLSDFVEPIAQANAEDMLDCVTMEVQLNSDGSSDGIGFDRTWIVDGVTLTNLDFVTVQNPGVYTLIVTDQVNGCTSESQVIVTENTDRPTDIAFDANDITCFGDNDGSFVVSQIEGGTAPYIFDVDGQSFEALPSFENLGPGTYPLTVTDATGCTLETTINIDEPREVFVELGEDIEINLGESVFLSANSNVQDIIWDTNGEILGCDINCFIQEVSPLTTTTYAVEVMDENGCIKTDNIVVRVNFDRAVYIPNAFSPNGDGFNDFFRVFGNSSVLRVQRMLIADRWGEIVFEAENIDLDDELSFWDGVHRGQNMNNDVLVYYVVVEYIDGRTESFKGDVSLLR